ncbi:MAG: methylmalonyl-CoA mutase family protein [Caldilinea sp.]|nr:methylmalonyl-CoA mutase family protein [Caldilinea sp.]MCB9114200.1 methylmalonyl-CoA mutase family protein [Caldilineaceae bacterium]MCB9120826.1 methylmalonyl-CoA mutase family protein [Caldilineaceae bacterium]MCB9123903.1 methylmalonyl-CoA mutase family protein [Caldilineaceae bacterium]MCO5209765.1 methylmalonyl-CoA mutase family protein [Caldilinea sp.]
MNLYDERALDDVAEQTAAWKAGPVRQAVERFPERYGEFSTMSGVPIERLYTPADSPAADYAADLGLPSEYPYTRGVHATGYRGRLWTMRMFAGFGTAEETNQRFKYLLQQGQTGLSVAFDMPTLYGYDTDAPEAEGEFGLCGVACSSLADMEVLLDGLPLDAITTSMTINSPAAMIWAMYIAAAEKRGINRVRLGGTLQNDILKEYIAQKEFIFPPRPSMRLVTDTVEFAAREMPLWNPISVSGYHIREAGSTAVQELAFTLADGFEYVRWAIARGLDVDDFAPRISFFFNAHNDFFEEIAKYRAARRIWAREMKGTFGARNPRSWMLRFHTQTAGVSLTAQQPLNNVARVALQALAAVLGGTQSLHTNSLDEALALPSEDAVTVALRTQQIIAHESGVTNTVDPLGGSFFVEALTDEMERQARTYFRQIDEHGGVLPALEEGFFQREITEAAVRYQREVESRRRIIVGVNDYVSDGTQRSVPILEMDVEGYRRQVARLAEVRRTRDSRAVTQRLGELGRAARRENTNLMAPLLAAVNEYATLQEMMDVLREAWGVYEEPAIL